jgi:hypothetical protein
VRNVSFPQVKLARQCLPLKGPKCVCTSVTAMHWSKFPIDTKFPTRIPDCNFAVASSTAMTQLCMNTKWQDYWSLHIFVQAVFMANSNKQISSPPALINDAINYWSHKATTTNNPDKKIQKYLQDNMCQYHLTHHKAQLLHDNTEIAILFVYINMFYVLGLLNHAFVFQIISL